MTLEVATATAGGLAWVAWSGDRTRFISCSQDCGIELWYADGIQVLNSTIWRRRQNWSRGIRVGVGTAHTQIANNPVRGEIRFDGGDAELSHNLTRRLEGYFVDPAAGNLIPTPSASGIIDQGAPRPDVTGDIRGEPRGNTPDLGAWEVGQGGNLP